MYERQFRLPLLPHSLERYYVYNTFLTTVATTPNTLLVSLLLLVHTACIGHAVVNMHKIGLPKREMVWYRSNSKHPPASSYICTRVYRALCPSLWDTLRSI